MVRWKSCASEGVVGGGRAVPVKEWLEEEELCQWRSGWRRKSCANEGVVGGGRAVPVKEWLEEEELCQ